MVFAGSPHMSAAVYVVTVLAVLRSSSVGPAVPQCTADAAAQDEVKETRISVLLFVRDSRSCIGASGSAKTSGTVRARSIGPLVPPEKRTKTVGARVLGTHQSGFSPPDFEKLVPQSTMLNLRGAGSTNGGVHGLLLLLPGSVFGLTALTVGADAGNRPTHQPPAPLWCGLQ